MVGRNEKIKLPENPQKEGYTFVGWYWDLSTMEDKLTEDSLVNNPINRDRSVYAKWQVNEYTITYYTQSESFILPQTYEYQESITFPDEPTKTGYTFQGWYHDENCTQRFFGGAMPSKNLELYALWKENTTD